MFLKPYLKKTKRELKARCLIPFVVAVEAVHLLAGLEVRFGGKERHPEAHV